MSSGGAAEAGSAGAPRRPKLLSLKAPAKVNLGLRLMGRRADGYHLLESLFAPIALYDEIRLEAVAPGTAPGPSAEASGRVHLTLEVPPDAGLSGALGDVTAGPDNLVSRAAHAHLAATGFDADLEIHLVKRIPAGAGLGGGSSDAAAVLRGLQQMCPRPLGTEALHALALELGADVPFFLDPAPALVTGIGEELQRIPPLPALHLVLVNSGNSLATAEVYRAADALPSALTEPSNGSTMRAISRLAGERADLEPALGELLINDLEPAARRLCPPVARMSNRLRASGAIAVSMSGSGATVFGVFESEADAERGAKRFAETFDAGVTEAASESEETDGKTSQGEERRGRQEAWVRVTEIISANVM
ncbi:MAG: 4-(cytidine 5'-diphospho)-2-C-methyl-D-erythritol kinase [Myxococcota bacterium]